MTPPAIVAPADVTSIPLDLFFRSLEKRGLSLNLEGETGIALAGPKEAVNDGIRAYIVARKPDIVAHLKQTQADYSSKNNSQEEIEALGKSAFEQATNRASFYDVGYLNAANFHMGAVQLVHASQLFDTPFPDEQAVIRNAIDEPVPVHSALFGEEIIIASTFCPIAAIHADTVVYRTYEILHGLTSYGTAEDLRTFHEQKRALLSVWLRVGGNSWVYEEPITFWRDGRKQTDPGSKDNARSIANAAGLSWSVANGLIDFFCELDLMRSWCPDSKARLCLVTPIDRARRRKEEAQRRELQAAVIVPETTADDFSEEENTIAPLSTQGQT